MTNNLLNGKDTSNWSLNCVKCETNCDTYESKFEHSQSVFENSNDVIHQSTLDLDGKEIQAYLTQSEIGWLYQSPPKKRNAIDQGPTRYTISVSNLLVAHYEQKAKQKEENSVELFPNQYFALHYVKRTKNKWKPQSFLFAAEDTSACQQWVEAIQEIIQDFVRPRKLLVFINPVGGKKLARKIYKEKAAPYFEIAGIDVTTVVTERVNHAKDYLETNDLTSYDGVVSVGGDGLCSEIINGMIHIKDDVHQGRKNKKDKGLMLGIIPAGSTDTVAYCTSGTNDQVTAAVNIILGRELPLDICSVWQDGDFLKYSMSLMGYGYFGDLIKESQSLQWLGPKRYDLAGFKRFMINKSYEGEVRFIKADDDLDDSFCKSECARCSTFIDETDLPSGKELWQTVSGRFISVIGANMSCRCARSSTGISPHSHTGDGYIDLILIRKTTRTRYLQHLIKVSEKTVDQFNFDFIEVHRVKEFTFNSLQQSGKPQKDTGDSATSTSMPTSTDTSVWNIDGELVESPHIHIKKSYNIHHQMIFFKHLLISNTTRYKLV